jgi:hypothetical protein
MHRLRRLVIALCPLLLAACGPMTPIPVTGLGLVNGQWVRVIRIAGDASTVAVFDPAAPLDGARVLAAPTGPLREAARLVAPGDTVRISLKTGGTDLTDIAPVTVPVGRSARAGALALAALGVILPAWLLFGTRLRWVVIGEDNRYSASKFQMVLWTIAVLASYLAAVALRGIHGGAFLAGGVEIPANVLWISGLSVLGFAGAKQIVASRLQNAPAGTGHFTKPASPVGSRFPRDLVTDDSGQRPDLGDIQMLVISLIAAGTYVIQVFGWLGVMQLNAHVVLPDIGNTMLGLFGAGQAAYLGKKMSGDTGATAAPGPPSHDLPPKPPL